MVSSALGRIVSILEVLSLVLITLGSIIIFVSVVAMLGELFSEN